MNETCRVSVRELAAFSYYEPDIRPQAGVMESMRLGTQAHKACQSGLTGAEIEKAIQHTFVIDGHSVQVYGRMDAFVDGPVPLVDEIKLGCGNETSSEPAHRAQAMCYAAMLAAERDCAAVSFQVRYVDAAGQTLTVFQETLDQQALAGEAEALLRPWLSFALSEAAYRAVRDQSLKALAFPFASYRPGQRELAVQVYTAISRKKRLFASLPTGTGKSAAVLYPALKALGEGKTGKILYLTSRNTARQSPLNTLKRMDGLTARVSVLTAREKLCPHDLRCNPQECPRAAGHFVRQRQAVNQLLSSSERLWTDDQILHTADQHNVCPFELALALSELADVVLMDLNYAFDPFAQAKRLFQRRRDLTLLIDEAHHATDRVRDSLSGSLDSRQLCTLRASLGKRAGRKNTLYRALSCLIHSLRTLPDKPDQVPPDILSAAESTMAEASASLPEYGQGEALALLRLCMPFLYAAEHLNQDYTLLTERHGKERVFTLYCLYPGHEIARVTKGLPGSVFFSATLQPLPAMKQLLGGGEEDACFSLPSPFSPEHLAVIHRRLNTRYGCREQSAAQVAQAIEELFAARPGRYIAYFPSYAYLRLVRPLLEHLPLIVQSQDMEESQRDAFLSAFTQDEAPKLGLCVLGGLFSEGIDLPGNQLIGVAIVGVGLPTPTAQGEALQQDYQRRFGDGFGYACRIPAMQKVLQAAGRVIRSETDRGMVLLLDDRYADPDYRRLLPREWNMREEDIRLAAQRLEASP